MNGNDYKQCYRIGTLQLIRGILEPMEHKEAGLETAVKRNTP